LEDSQRFIDQLNARTNAVRMFSKSGRFVLPHEDEWEYACRGGKGNKQPFYFGTQINGLEANMKGTSPYGTMTKGPFLNHTSEVGNYFKVAPHPWGLCDMHGNVWEWCALTTSNPMNVRVFRGGCYGDEGERCRAANRGFPETTTIKYMNIGFRVCFRPN
jgi:formylglycine-generating enzyme required for sulfatase activity